MSIVGQISSDGLMRSVLGSIRDGCQVLGFDWTYLDLNEAGALQARRQGDELLGRSMLECFPGIDRTPMFDQLRRCMTDRTYGRTETEFTHPDGTHGWFELRIVPVPEGLCVLSLDISERKLAEGQRQRSEEALRQIEGRFNAFMDAVTAGAWIRDEHSRFVYVNKAWEQITGISSEQALGQTPLELMPLDVGQRAIDSDVQLLATGEGGKTHFHLFSPTEQDRWFEITNFLIREGPGTRYVGGLTVETTAEKRRDADIRQAEENLRLLIDGVQDYSILLLDPRGHVTTWNNGARRFFGYMAEDILGADFQCFFPPEDIAARKPEAQLVAALTGGRAEYEGWRIRKDGTRFWGHAIMTPLFDPSSGRHLGFAEVIRDLTEPRKLEEQLRQAQKLDAIGSLAGGVAHDFNNLLSVILSYSQLLAEDLSPEDPMRADLEEIRAAGMRASDLTRQLLAFGRQQILHPEAMNLNDVIAGAERMLRRLVGENIEFTFLPAPDLWRVKVDRSQIEQVVVNLVVNARDAMPRGGKLTLETENIELSASYAEQHVGVIPGPHVMFAVSDNGVGMTAATRSRMFEPFFTTKERGKGTGLGLSTVFGIVRQSGAHIWVYSEPGTGTTLKIYFPRTGEFAASSVAAKAPTPVRHGTETILLVEDEEQVRTLVRNILQRNGYRVLEAQSGGDALLLCEQHAATIHLMLTDVIMPRMSGRQLAERLRNVRPWMKVLYMSGYTDNSIVHHGVLDSNVAFLQKPITPETLLRKVREVLDNRPAA